MNDNSALEYFQNYDGGFSPILVDVIFGVFLFSFFIIGMLLGAIRGSWFFLTTLAFVSIAWATSRIVGDEIYATIFKDQFSEAYQNVEELKYTGINLQPSIIQFIGFIYILVFTASATIVLTIPLFVFFSKDLLKYIKKMNKHKKGLSIFLGGMSGLLFSFILGFTVFFTTSSYTSIAFKKNSIKFQNFYCSIMVCEDSSFKSRIEETSSLVNSLNENAYENKSFTYIDIMKSFYRKNDDFSLIDINENSILTELDNMYALILLFVDNSEDIDEFIDALSIYNDYENLFGSTFSGLDNIDDKKIYLVDWIDEIITASIPWYVELGNSLVSNSATEDSISLLKASVYEKAGFLLMSISKFLEDIQGSSRTMDLQRIDTIKSIITNAISTVLNS